MSNTETFETLSPAEIDAVSGGQSILQDLIDRFPGGVWIGGSFYPDGPPSPPPSHEPVIWG